MNILAWISALRDWIAWILCLLISLILMNTSSHPGAETIRRSFGQVVSLLTRPLAEIPKVIGVFGENARLRGEVVLLTGERNSWRDAMLENVRLRKLLGFRDRPEFAYLASEVIARDPAVNLASLLLDKGKRDGVRVGHAVVTADGLAGVIFSARSATSVTQLATDRNFAASARIERSRVNGILHWQAGGLLRLDHVPKNLDVKLGDRVVSSGLGGVIPAGIPVGVGADVKRRQDDLVLLDLHIKEGEVEYAVNKKPLKDIDEAAAVLKRMKDVSPKVPLIIRCDARASVQQFVDLYNLATKIGFRRTLIGPPW